MFSYFGNKGRIAGLYPAPVHDRLIEPFCGSARYSCLHFDRDVWLNDKDPRLANVWSWLIRATKNDIRSLPVLRTGDRIEDLKELSEPERDLLGFASKFNTVCPGNRVATHGPEQYEQFRRRFLRIAGRIGHWKVTNLDYHQLPDIDGTWFVDPPYQQQKTQYRERMKPEDYRRLGQWCLSRRGQLIVCEGQNADWLPFRKMARLGRRGRALMPHDELVYYRSDVKTGFGFY